MKKTRRAYGKAVSLAEVQIDGKYVVFRLIKGVVQFNDNNDVIMDAMTVISTDYTRGELTYFDFQNKSKTVKLADLGIPILESGGTWDRTVCTVRLDDAITAVRKHIDSVRLKKSIPKHEITIGDGQRLMAY